tara:strand:+ start:8630 stop:9685 length:1056 start_codon:yes stop_codon:yes gene_type:complete
MSLLNELKKNYKVTVIAPFDEYTNLITQKGFNVENISLKRSGMSILNDIFLIYQYLILIKKYKPDFLLSYTIKPNIYGNLASIFSKTKNINTITGLGTVFLKENILTFFVRLLYKISFYFSSAVFFQNNDDKEYFLKNNIIKNSKAYIIGGSGIDLKYFNFVPYIYKKNRNFNFLFAGRLLWDKGIKELIESIKLIKADYPNVNFKFIGIFDNNNLSSISKETIQNWVDENLIDFIENTNDIKRFIIQSDCVILPSYREGLPKFLLESAAIGRPIICSDVPGCREIVKDSYNGILCNPKDTNSLYDKIKLFINLDEKTIFKMITNSRKIVESKFDYKKVNDFYLKIIRNKF